ncbi:MAG: 30S ribosomal protein S16 [Candidatus Latescibacteria bacterium]|nr:30S ribosomal protein S16 [Candidatus Latescibacterota bacterium]
MAVKLRLKRMGSKKRPFYRLVAADSRFQRDGRFIETLGQYDPRAKMFKLNVEKEKIAEWLGNGAQMSETAESLLRREGIVQEYNLSKMKLKTSSETEKNTQEENAEDGEVNAESNE